MSKLIFHDEFFAQIEALLKESSPVSIIEFFGHVRYDYRKLLPDVCKDPTDEQ